MSWFSVDVESDGPLPGKHSMVCFGAVVVEPSLENTFYGETAPISDFWKPQALEVSGITRSKHLDFESPGIVMVRFAKWIESVNKNGRPVFVSDNNGYDFAWMNYYFHTYCDGNPFGWSSRRIGDLYCGLVKDGSARWKHLRKTSHTHNPVDDAKGNAEAILEMQKMGLKLPL